MKLALVRSAFLLLAAATASLGAWAFWTQPTAFEADHPSLYALSGVALLVSVVALVACFAPFDRPRSAPRWAAPLAGLATGLTAAGVVLYTASFLWLAAPLLLYAYGVMALGSRIAGAAPRNETGGAAPGRADPDDGDLDNTMLHDTQLPGEPATQRLASALPARPDRGARILLAVFGVAGVALAIAWRPPAGGGGVSPQPLEAAIATITSRPSPRFKAKRVTRSAEVVEINGNDVRVQVGLRRPRVLVTRRGQTLLIEPCLFLGAASTDGFLLLPTVNGYSLEPTGLALVEMAEGRRLRVEGEPPRSDQVVWVRADYPRGRATYGGVAGVAPSLGGRAGPDSVRASVEVEVDPSTGRVVIDAVTHLLRPAAVHSSTLGWMRLLDLPPGVPIVVGMGEEGIRFSPARRHPGSRSQRLEFFVAEDEQMVRLLRAREGDEGPYETVEVGRFNSWFVLPGAIEATLLVAPDWFAQASRQVSRSAGHGLLENALIAWAQDGGLNLVFDLAGTRIGPGRLCAELPAGIYRNRLVLAPLRAGAPALQAAQELRWLERASATGEAK